MLETYQMDAAADALSDPVPIAYKTILDPQRDDQELQELQSSKDTAEHFRTHQYGAALLWTKQPKSGGLF